jgi:CHASE2 domain-containing sensor protein
LHKRAGKTTGAAELKLDPERQALVKDAVVKSIFSKTALTGAGLTVLSGFLLWTVPLGDPWINASYDFLFRFGSRSVTNQVALVLMDNESHDSLAQPRSEFWDRNLHAKLLDKLTDDGARIVVFDVCFKNTNSAATDSRLAEAIRRNGHVVLMTEVIEGTGLAAESYKIERPNELFAAAANRLGIGKADPETGGVARRHWPFYAPGEGEIHSLGWAAAETSGAKLDAKAEQQWLRYYGQNGPGEKISYAQALTRPPGYFRDRAVFIGNWPSRPNDPGSSDGDNDKFRTPYTALTGKSVGGMEIIVTTFLNLINGDWLRRPPAWSEATLLALTGILLGGGLCRLKPLWSLATAATIILILPAAFGLWSYSSNYWFPWLIIAGGQVPCAFLCAWALQTPRVQFFLERYPGYATVGEPFGKGSYGSVRVVRNITGELQALKEIVRTNPNFKDAGPYDREFYGIKNYKPVSNQHIGLLHIDHVNRNEREGYFYYVMELGDAQDPDWERKGELYQPLDLSRACERAAGGKLPVRDCLAIGIALCDTLEFLHERRLVHRDIKPSNVIFVRGHPKLADVGLVRDIVTEATSVGTPEYMPAPPEHTGTVAADIFALGKLLYVISTGIDVRSFPELTAELAEDADFMQLNLIICQACQPDAGQRYLSAAAMGAALQEIKISAGSGMTRTN